MRQLVARRFRTLPQYRSGGLKRARCQTALYLAHRRPLDADLWTASASQIVAASSARSVHRICDGPSEVHRWLITQRVMWPGR
jgi:hypothetical protein